jgi:hypothetical protein
MKIQQSVPSVFAALGLTFLLAASPARASVNVAVSPTSQVVFGGSNATFTAQVTTTGGETVTGYSWLRSTNAGGPYSTLAGRTTTVCTITNAQTADAGFYFVRVTYRIGTNSEVTLASTVATLEINDPPRITSHPQSLSVAVGKSAAFSVTSLGVAPLSYQWRVNGTNLVNGGRFSGVNGSNLGISGLLPTDDGGYDVVITNKFGGATSQVATLTVLIPPFITTQPADWTTIVGSNSTVQVVAGGTIPLSYQWRKGNTVLANGARISGVTTDTLAINGALTSDAGSYSVVITNLVGATTSAVARLTVLVPPRITSATNLNGRQGAPLTYTITATGTTPITFGAEGLPLGLSLVPESGIISGTPTVTGVFSVVLFATNVAMTTTAPLTIRLTTGVPGITSALAAGGKQGLNFAYQITASNNPTVFSASGLPSDLQMNSATGRISGRLLVPGVFPVTIGVANTYGSDSRTIMLTVTSSVPVITSPLTATGVENDTNFLYTITATEAPFEFGAIDLPMGLKINSTNGVISGPPTYGGTFPVVIWARNAWGTGTNTLVITVSYATIAGLVINDVTYAYSSPYLLDFAFALRDSDDPAVAQAVVRPPSAVQVTCFEDGLPIGKETAFVVDRGDHAKVLKTFLVLDYSFSMFIVPDAIMNMQTAAKNLIIQEPVGAQFGIYEFHSDIVDPTLVTGFKADKTALTADIDGILTNYVKENFAGTRCWDAVYAALGQFGATNAVEQRYMVVMTDGNDDSSLLNTNADPVGVIVKLAKKNAVKLYCVAFGDDINTNALQQMTTQTGGRYFVAADAGDLITQFALLLKDVRAQYLLRWATLKRANKLFQPSFQVAVDGFLASYNTNVVWNTNIEIIIDTNTTPPTYTTNITVEHITDVPDYNPTNFAGNINIGSLNLAADAVTNASSVTLRASYVPRYVRKLKIHYRSNYACTPALNSTGPGEILSGWSMTETNDGAGGQWLTLVSANTSNLLSSVPYGVMGELVTFHFQYADLPAWKQAFSVFDVDNSVYTNMPPGGQSFVLANTNLFITVYTNTAHGTPVPWLMANGVTNNFDAGELTDPTGKGLPLWQQYQAGLNPKDTNSVFVIRSLTSGQPDGQPEIIFSSVVGRTYLVQTATVLGNWTPLLENIPGVGGDIRVTDLRTLGGVNNVYYRVLVY